LCSLFVVLVVKNVADCCLHEVVFFVLVSIKLVNVLARVRGWYEWRCG